MYMKTFFNNTIKEVIVPTDKTKDFLKQRYHLKQNINIIPNGIDTKKFDYKKISKKDILKLKKLYKINDNDFVVSWIGRLGYEKRVD